MITHNQKVKQNGDFGESVAPILLNNKFGKLIFIDDIIDYISDNGTYIEIKTCQNYIKSGNDKYPMRLGRFYLLQSQHTFLINRRGYYLFIVKSGDMVIRAKLISAAKIFFKRAFTWEKFFNLHEGDLLK